MRPLLAILVLGSIPAVCPALAPERTEARSTLKHFERVDEGVYKGSKPITDADYRYLQSLHVKYIVDLQVIPFMASFERRKAARYGITVIPGIMNASPFSPSEKHVERILAILRDKRYHPVYFHCKYGRDRTAIIAALYKMYFQGMTEQQAMQYLHASGYGFKFGWVRSGLMRYLKNHPEPPPELVSSSSVRQRSRNLVQRQKYPPAEFESEK
jgi:protein tyrosine/serine phosphatase